MMFKRFPIVALTLIAILGSTRVMAQTRNDPRSGARRTPPPREDSRTFQFWVKGQAQYYDNFFQATEGQPQDNIGAVLGEIGANARLSRTMPLRAYGSFNDLKYDEKTLDDSPGVRLGLRLDGNVHSFDVYGEELFNRPSFEIGNEFDTADIGNVVGRYSYRFARNWQMSVDGELQHQDIAISSQRDNDFAGFGAALRWRGSRLLSPEVGVRMGTRDVKDPTFEYDQDEYYVQLRSTPTPSLYLSLRFRDRNRDYTTNVTNSSYFGREDKRRQLTLTADWNMTKSLTWNFYGSHETDDTNQPGRDFDTALYLLGITWHF